jgi:hypothetical protein
VIALRCMVVDVLGQVAAHASVLRDVGACVGRRHWPPAVPGPAAHKALYTAHASR